MPKQRRRGWGAAIKTAYNGVLYDSKAEASYARRLDELVDAGEVSHWDRQRRWPLVVNGVKVCVMVPDFVVWYEDGDDMRMELHEVKGFQTPVYRLKRKLFEALHPEVIYLVIPAKEV
jgi:hypothetical protein